MITDLDSKLYIPSEKRLISIARQQGEFIFDFLCERSISKTLEIGMAYGYSTAFIMTATKSEHYAVDPFQYRFDNIGIDNVRSLGLEHNLVHLQEPSHLALPRLLMEQKKFQFIFVDGAHRFDDIFLDWYYADLLLEEGGFVFFHDGWMRSTQTVCQFIRSNRADYKDHGVSADLLIFEKTGEDARPWDHFREFLV